MVADVRGQVVHFPSLALLPLEPVHHCLRCWSAVGNSWKLFLLDGEVGVDVLDGSRGQLVPLVLSRGLGGHLLHRQDELVVVLHQSLLHRLALRVLLLENLIPENLRVAQALVFHVVLEFFYYCRFTVVVSRSGHFGRENDVALNLLSLLRPLLQESLHEIGHLFTATCSSNVLLLMTFNSGEETSLSLFLLEDSLNEVLELSFLTSQLPVVVLRCLGLRVVQRVLQTVPLNVQRLRSRCLLECF